MASPAGIDWLGLIWNCFVKSSWALLIAILLAGLMRRHSASLRHFILSLFLIGLVFLPLFSVLPSGWELRWLPSWLDARVLPQAKIEPAAIERNLLSNELSSPKPTPSADDDLYADGKMPPSANTGILNFGRLLEAGLILLWLAGLFFLLARLALGILGASRLTREGETLDDSAWQRLLQRFVSAVSIRRKVGLKSHRKVVVPLTWGLLRPVVIMPAGAASWDEEKRSSALFHELSHVKRADFMVTLLVRLSLALFWFNPLSWIVFKMLKSEQEKACDELALRAGIRPSAYAASLLSIKRSAGLPGYSSAAVLGMSGRSQLNDRLLAILRQKLAFKEIKMKTKIMISVIAFLAVVLIGLARPSGASNPDKARPVAREAMIGAVDNVSLDTIVQESQQTQESQEKKQPEKAAEPQKPKEKAKKEMTIEIGAKEGSEGPIEITIIEGDSKKIIQVDKPVIKIKNDQAGKKIVVLSGGKEVLVIEGDAIQLKVKGDKAVFLKSAEPSKLNKGLEIKSTTKDEAGEKQIIIEGEPYVEIVKGVDIPRRITIQVESKEGEDKTMVVRPHVDIEPGIDIEPHVHVHEIVTGALRQEELQKIIAETQTLLKKIEDMGLDEAKLEAQKETLQELKESLKDLNQELEKEKENLKAIRLKVDEPEKSFSVVVPKPDVTLDSSVDVLEKGKDNVITIIDDKGTCTVVFTGKLRENQKEAYERAVEKVKKGLPEGYELESEFHEKSGMIVIKIKGHDTNKDSRELVKSLIKELKEELEK
jgi:beta-lactamase regulating signal transducer with metallopeptidase domain